MTQPNAPKNHLGGMDSRECNALCRPAEGIHACVSYSSYDDIEYMRRRVISHNPRGELLEIRPAPEAIPYTGPKRPLPYAWLCIVKWNARNVA